MTFEDLKKSMRENQPDADLELVELAYEYAKEAHEGQTRVSGEPYITHPLATAYKLSQLHLDQTTIIAGLLHDVPEDTERTVEDLAEHFGEEIAFLVEGITKLGTIKYRGIDRFAENLRKMFVAMAEDMRVIFIKFADRIHNLETLDSLPVVKQQRIARESIDIYAAIGERLSMGRLKDQLEDLSFPYAYPKEYEWLKGIVKHTRPGKKKMMQDFMKVVEKVFKESDVNIQELYGRVKRDFSLYKKLIKPKYNNDVDKIHDIVAIRVIVPEIRDCYHVLGLIHQNWKPMPERFKDYIAQPKLNGYQSLHSVVFTNTGQPIEFQIRTQNMHEIAEYGIAAHFHYKEKGSGKPTLSPEAEVWLEQLQRIQEEIKENAQFIETLKLDMFSHRIFVFTPKGDVIDLPDGANSIDFAYHIHTDVGNHCGGSKVNNKLTSLDHKLQSGDVVDIIIDKKRTSPSEDWLDIVQTHTAREKIKAAIRKRQQGIITRLLYRD